MFATPTLHKIGGENYAVTHGEDRELYVEFSTEPVYQGAESIKSGRPIYKETPFITILFPGDKTKKIHRPVNMTPEESAPNAPDPERFPKQWAAYRANASQIPDGTPLEQWPPVNRSQVLELKHMSVHTVEQLAGMSDVGVQSLGPGGLELRRLAQSWLKQAQGGEELARVSAELSKRDDQINALTAQIQQLNEQMKQLTEKGKK